MKNPTGSLLLFLTLMISAMAFYLNLGNMLYEIPLTLMNSIASALFLLVWAALAAYSIFHQGKYSAFFTGYWFLALIAAAICVITISGITKVLEYLAYLMLFLLTPLFGLRFFPAGYLLWATIMAVISLAYVAAGFAALDRRGSHSRRGSPPTEPPALPPQTILPTEPASPSSPEPAAAPSSEIAAASPDKELPRH